MKTLYLECKMGIAGDMFASALLGLFDNAQDKIKELNDIGIETANILFIIDFALSLLETSSSFEKFFILLFSSFLEDLLILYI